MTSYHHVQQVLTPQGNRDACNIYDVGTETISELRWIPGNMSIRPCEQFEFREGIVTVVTQVSICAVLLIHMNTVIVQI